MSIIITGATGLLGAYMVRHFAARGHDIFTTYHQAGITDCFSLPEADAIIKESGTRVRSVGGVSAVLTGEKRLAWEGEFHG